MRKLKNTELNRKSIEEFNSMSIVQRNEMAKKARKFAEENFSLNKMIESFENLL